MPVTPPPPASNSELDVSMENVSTFVEIPYPSKERVSEPADIIATDKTLSAPAYSAILAADAPENRTTLISPSDALEPPPAYSPRLRSARASSTSRHAARVELGGYRRGKCPEPRVERRVGGQVADEHRYFPRGGGILGLPRKRRQAGRRRENNEWQCLLHFFTLLI